MFIDLHDFVYVYNFNVIDISRFVSEIEREARPTANNRHIKKPDTKLPPVNYIELITSQKNRRNNTTN